MADSVGDTAKRTKSGIVPWNEARRFLDRHLATMREEINIMDDPFSKAVALREIMRWWRAASLVLVRLRLPKKRKFGRDKYDLAYTVRPEGKITARRSRVRGLTNRRKRKGRSHHKGVYGVRNPEGKGRPPKYLDEAAKKAAARHRARRSYLNRTHGRKRRGPWLPKEARQKRKEFFAKLKAARATVRSEMKLERIARQIGNAILHKGDHRQNHRTDYAYKAPAPRIRRTKGQVKRWGRKKPVHGKEAEKRKSDRNANHTRRKVVGAVMTLTVFFRAKKRMEAMFAGRAAYWEAFGKRVHGLCPWSGRRLGAKGR